MEYIQGNLEMTKTVKALYTLWIDEIEIDLKLIPHNA